MVVDPAGLAHPLEVVARARKRPEHTEISRRILTGIRCAGAILVLIALAL
jgi:hypothetical protein